jgi:acyl-CoA thioester hydrolase
VPAPVASAEIVVQSAIRSRSYGPAHTIPGVPEPFVHELRVRYAECDAQGIVFNANYLLYFDVAHTELWRAAVGPWHEMVAGGVDLVVANASLRFRAPARFDEVIALKLSIVELGETNMTTQFDVVRDDTLLVAGQLEHVCVDAQTWKRTALPEAITSALRPYVAAQSATRGA